MADSKIKTVIEKAIKKPELQPYLWKEIIDRHGKTSFNILSEYGMFEPEHRNQKYGWEALTFIELFLKKYGETLSEDVFNQIRTIIAAAMEFGGEDYKLYRQIIIILSMFQKVDLNAKDLDVLDEIVSNRDEHQNLLSYVHYSLYTDLASEGSPVAKRLFYLIFKTAVKRNNSNMLVTLSRDRVRFLNIIETGHEKVLAFLIDLLSKELDGRVFTYSYKGVEFKSVLTNHTYKLRIEGKLIDTWASISHEQSINRARQSLDTFAAKHEIDIKEMNMDYVTKLLVVYPISEKAAESIFASRKHLFEPCEYIVYFVKVIFDCKIIDIDQIKKLLSSEYVLENKLGLYLIISKYTEYRGLLKEQIEQKTEAIDFIIRYYYFGDEVKRLFKCINDDHEFTHNASIENNLMEIINRGRYIPRETQEYKDSYFEQSRLRELTNIEAFRVRHEELMAKSQIDYQLNAAMYFGDVVTISQLFTHSVQDLVDMSNEQIVKIYNEYDPRENKTNDYNNEYSYRGANDVLTELIVAAPEKILGGLEPFRKLDHVYSFGLFYGFRSLQFTEQNFKKIYLRKLMEFTHYFIGERINNKEMLKTVEEKRQSPFEFIQQYMWTIDRINDESIDNLKLFCDTTEKIINHFVNKPEELFESVSIKDLPHLSINSVLGTTIAALIHYTGDCFRKNEDETKPIWRNCVSKHLDVLGAGCNSIIAHFCIGENIDLLYYINPEWSKGVIEKLKLDSEDTWAFIAGYAQYARVYRDTISILAKLIEKALEADAIDEDTKERLVSKLAIAFLNDFDGFESLLDSVISTLNSKYILALIRLIGSIDNEEVSDEKYMEFAKKSIIVWGKVLKCLSKSHDKPKAKSVAQHIFEFVRPFKYLNSEVLERIQESISVIDNLNAISQEAYIEIYAMTEFLSHHLDSNVDGLESVVVSYLSTFTPDYEEEQVKNLIRFVEDDIGALIKIKDAYLNKNFGRNEYVLFIIDLLERKHDDF